MRSACPVVDPLQRCEASLQRVSGDARHAYTGNNKCFSDNSRLILNTLPDSKRDLLLRVGKSTAAPVQGVLNSDIAQFLLQAGEALRNEGKAKQVTGRC
jgi:hypothetical protein